MALKNIWSLTIDEALAADEIKKYFPKRDYEVFFPTNAQLKDVDLILFNLKSGKSKTIQVKGSRTYEPRASEVQRYGAGSAAWITINKSAIFNTKNKLDFFIFVLHSFLDGLIKKEIKINYLVIPIKILQNIARKKVIGKHGKYHFFIWIDPKGKRAFDFHDAMIPLSKYLDNWNYLR